MTTRAERMLGAVMEAASLADAVTMTRGVILVSTWHQSLSFARDHPDLAAELMTELDKLYATAPVAPSSRHFNAYLLDAARELP